jgi:bidirectional [NiFe] hydrogenase diaphorase subunit
LLKDDKRLVLLEKVMEEHQYQRSALLEILHRAQELYGYLDKRLLALVAESLNLPSSRVYGVATFYNFFRLKKPGEHVVTACMGTACYVRGVEEILSAIKREFNIKQGESTADERLSLFVTRCIGACAMGPNIVVDGEIIGKATKEAVLEKIKLLLGGVKVETG